MKKGLILKVVASLMVVFYTALAGLLIFSPVFETTFSLTLRTVAGIVFFLYALLRAYRIFKK